jgi:hypothetical protein
MEYANATFQHLMRDKNCPLGFGRHLGSLRRRLPIGVIIIYFYSNGYMNFPGVAICGRWGIGGIGLAAQFRFLRLWLSGTRREWPGEGGRIGLDAWVGIDGVG